MSTVLVTGGAGYIGSHTIIALHEAGYDFVVVDNLVNAHPDAIKRVEAIIGTSIPFHKGDVADKAFLTSVFEEHSIDAVIHFAGLKAVGESVSKPLTYYRNNLGSTLTLLEVMNTFKVKKIVFSSSATVYSEEAELPLDEASPLACTNPYGWTKYMIEQMLRDVCVADSEMSAVCLRYFNPLGAHASGTIGESPNGIPNNLMPYITQVAVGKLPELGIFGDDYDTVDGTGVRDYIHVLDLADGHVKALSYVNEYNGSEAINLGTGVGTSVLQLVKAFEEASGIEIPYKIKPRRPGDIDAVYADPQKAQELLGWKATRDINQMCSDSWRWQSQNPNGYDEA